jgi:uncharacterized YigZ family protein
MSDFYKTLKEPCEGLYKEKMSKFISFAHPVNTAEEAKEIIKRYQKEYFDARHVCWAYMIGAARTEYQSNDNGEPSGTAGKPILGQINSFELTNVVIVVIRYFGGIKLGTSGLIVAYREAAAEAIRNGEIIECHEQAFVEFLFPYLAMNDVMKVIKNSDVEIMEQIFDNSCQMKLAIRADHADALRTRLADIDGVSVLPYPQTFI